MTSEIISKIKKSPTTPGVYIFQKSGSPLYIGKASNLRSRLKNYLQIHDLKSKILSKESTNLKIIQLASPIEALIKESQLIKTLKPKYNILWQDDKNYFYVAFTQDKFPKIFVTHQPFGTAQGKPQKSDIPVFAKSSTNKQNPISNTIGPFTDGASLKIVLRLLRRHFPYCTCSKPHARECLNTQINNCSGYCCNLPLFRDRGIVEKNNKAYQKNIRAIKNILSGRNKSFIKKLRTPSEMFAVENIYSHHPFLTSNLRTCDVLRLECYDISHFAGKEAVGAMTVLTCENNLWRPKPSLFRKFKIKNLATQNDPRSIAEILSRRLKHSEWPYPDIIIIDGGIAQYNAAKKILGKFFNNEKAPHLLSFAKPKKRIYGPKNLLPKEILEKAIEQTHRFVVKFHRQTREKTNFLNEPDPDANIGVSGRV